MTQKFKPGFYSKCRRNKSENFSLTISGSFWGLFYNIYYVEFKPKGELWLMLAWVRWECAWRGCVYRADGGRGGEWQPHGAAHHDQRLQDCLSREGEGQSYSNKDKNQVSGAGQVFGFFWFRLVSFLLNVPVRWLFRLAHAGCSTLCAQTENGARQIFRGTGFSWLSSLLRFRFTLTSKGFHVGQENNYRIRRLRYIERK